MIEIDRVDTERLPVALRRISRTTGVPLLMLHGNNAGSRWMEPLMQALHSEFTCIAPDLRGYGDSEPAVIDATQGADDWACDMIALLDVLDVEKCHVLGWSLGAAVAMRLCILAPERVASLILVAPVSPYGFGGSSDLDGTPNFPDHAGSGGGIVNPAYAQAVIDKDASNGPGSVRHIMRHNILGRFGETAERDDEDDLLGVIFQQQCGERAWPGDFDMSPNWPFVTPGLYGPMNAISPRYFGAKPMLDLERKPPVLRIQGSADSVVSDLSLFDPCTQGMLGHIPEWPGLAPQPMVSQMSRFLERYRQWGGHVEEKTLPGCGHAPIIEADKAVAKLIRDFVSGVTA